MAEPRNKTKTFFFSKRGAQCHFKGGGAIQTLFSAGLRAVQQINKN